MVFLNNAVCSSLCVCARACVCLPCKFIIRDFNKNNALITPNRENGLNERLKREGEKTVGVMCAYGIFGGTEEREVVS